MQPSDNAILKVEIETKASQVQLSLGCDRSLNNPRMCFAHDVARANASRLLGPSRDSWTGKITESTIKYNGMQNPEKKNLFGDQNHTKIKLTLKSIEKCPF